MLDRPERTLDLLVGARATEPEPPRTAVAYWLLNPVIFIPLRVRPHV